MPESWLKAYTDYDWTVDLTKYIKRSKYPGYFNQTITLGNLIDFENKFRESLENNEYQTTGEVCFWKNYGTFQSRNHLTIEILKQLSQPSKWSDFTKCLVDLCTSPTYQNFDALRKSVGQPKGFATPITFLSFYDPHSYPMVDKNVAYIGVCSIDSA